MARRTDPTRATVVAVRERDLWRCVMCGAHEGARTLTTHHRANRGMGGSSRPELNLPANLLTLCGSGTTGCHGWVTAHPRKSYDVGLMVPKHRDPMELAVFTWRGWAMLDNEAGFHLLDTEPAWAPS